MVPLHFTAYLTLWYIEKVDKLRTAVHIYSKYIYIAVLWIQIRIQELCGSVFPKRIRIHISVNLGQKLQDSRHKFTI